MQYRYRQGSGCTGQARNNHMEGSGGNLETIEVEIKLAQMKSSML